MELNMENNEKCSRYENCVAFQETDFKCKGCGYKHYEKILKNPKYAGSHILTNIGNKHFKECSGRKKEGARINLDEPIRQVHYHIWI